MGGIGFVEGAVDVPTAAFHGRVCLTFTIVVFTAFHFVTYISSVERVSVLYNGRDPQVFEEIADARRKSRRRFRFT